MSSGDVTLTAALRSNLLSLQGTQTLLDQTQLRLSTGLKVNSVLDNPAAFFAAQALNNRAGDLNNLLDGMGQAVQTLKAADEGIQSISALLEQAQAVAQDAKDALAADANADVLALSKSFNSIIEQVKSLAGDSGYRGTNLLAGPTSDTATGTAAVVGHLTVNFSETTNPSKLKINGFDFAQTAVQGQTTTTGPNSNVLFTATNQLAADNLFGTVTAGSATAGDGFQVTTATSTAGLTQKNAQFQINALKHDLTSLRNAAASLGSNLNIIQTRQSFTSNLINTLKEGADKLTVADKNEEGAKLLSLQTTQQLGITSLALASQANQSILRLFG